MKVFPAPLPKPTPDNIPQPMRSDLDEAKKCLAAGCLVAAAIMARRVIQGACVHQGADHGNLVTQTEWLLSNHLITAKQKTWMDAVRWLGNMGAHPNKEEVAAGGNAVDADTVRAAVEVAEQFLTVLYVTDSVAQQVINVARANTAPRGQ